MKISALKYTVLTWVSGFVIAILLLMPFHAFLTVWLSGLVGHYTALRLWKEVLLIVCIIGTAYLIATDHKIRSHTITRRLVWLIFAYMALSVIWGLLALNQHDVTAKALVYGLIVNLRFLAFFLVTWAAALRLNRLRTKSERLVYWPAIVVVVIGLLQIFLLPNDFLRHFGYNASTILPVETINHNQNYVRFFSTLRGANPLGAYLLIPISLVTAWLLSARRSWRQALFLAAALVVLFFTFSRSAWVGAALAVVTVFFLSRLSRRSQQISLAVAGCLVLVGAALAIGFRHDMKFENFVLHTQTHSAVPTTSDQGHVAALKNGLRDLSHHAMGDGPGTAGPASVYNNHPVRIAENYYIQIGQEVGWIGLLMFVLINVGVGYLLFVRRADPLALSLFASLIGITFISMLSHAWTDDTLAYVWWGLAGIAMVPLAQVQTGETQDGKAKE
jgi:hypothetical protein